MILSSSPIEGFLLPFSTLLRCPREIPSFLAFSATLPLNAAVKALLSKFTFVEVIMNNITSISLEYKKTPDRIQQSCILLVNMGEKLSQLVARRIRELGISNSELARKTELSRGYIGNIVNETAPTQSGQYNLSPESVSKLAKALEISEAEILATMNYLPSAESSDAISADLDEDVRVQLLGGKNYTEEEKREFLESFQIAYAVAKRRITEKKKHSQ